MKIIVGYDGSEPAKRTLERPAALAGDQSRVVVVAEPWPRSGITIPATWEKTGGGRTISTRRAGSYRAEGSTPKPFKRKGDPADVLLEASTDADLVIVGSGRLNRLQRLILGSVSSKVVHDAACDVLVVR
jgi:nucleotide-binding universal stress UspA family protein